MKFLAKILNHNNSDIHSVKSNYKFICNSCKYSTQSSVIELNSFEKDCENEIIQMKKSRKVNGQKVNEYFKSKENQIKFMEKLFYQFKLNNIDDWLKISRKKLIKNGGSSLLLYYYKNNFPLLLSSIYVNFPFEFSQLKAHSHLYFKSIQNQRQFMDNLFQKFNLKSFDDWLNISRKKIRENGGKSLLFFYYQNNFSHLLSSIYPNFPFQFNQLKPHFHLYFKSIDHQRLFMDNLFTKFRLKSLEDWLNISQHKIRKNGGEMLFYYYKFDFSHILQTIYPNFPWLILLENFQYHPFTHYCKSRSYLKEKLQKLIKKYFIYSKKDWYRLAVISDQINIYKTLKLIYPNEKWKKKDFTQRSKKTNQRLLFGFLQRIYSMQLIFENYHHPKMMSSQSTSFSLSTSSSSFEYDIFIPALNVGVEYQGEQHFDDIPAAFEPSDSFRYRDCLKENLSSLLLIKIIYIPFWWDHSFSSLLSTLQSQFFSPFSSTSS